jgi:hypothetical protein
MVAFLRMAVSAIPRALRNAPAWAKSLADSVSALHEKVNLLMSFDVSILNRILVGSQFLVDQHRKDKSTIADLQSKLADAGAAAVADSQADSDASAAAAKVADEVEALVQGDQTPTVEVPADPQDVVDVVSGTTEPTVTDAGPVADGTLTDSSSNSSVDSTGGALGDPSQDPFSG